MMQNYSGGCQCGAVRYQVSADIGEVISCNCSRCAKMGWLLTFVPASAFHLKSGKDAVTEYLFNNKHVHHLFCSTCGVESYAYGKGPGGADMVAINVRCLDDVDPDGFKVKKIDGRSL